MPITIFQRAERCLQMSRFVRPIDQAYWICNDVKQKSRKEQNRNKTCHQNNLNGIFNNYKYIKVLHRGFNVCIKWVNWWVAIRDLETIGNSCVLALCPGWTLSMHNVCWDMLLLPRILSRIRDLQILIDLFASFLFFVIYIFFLFVTNLFSSIFLSLLKSPVNDSQWVES